MFILLQILLSNRSTFTQMNRCLLESIYGGNGMSIQKAPKIAIQLKYC